MVLSTVITGCINKTNKPDSNFNGVQIGVITYSWRSMPGTPQDIINYCLQDGISSIELMGNVAEEHAGAPEVSRLPRNFKELSQEEQENIKIEQEVSLKEISEWRVSGSSAEKYKELRKICGLL